MLGKPLPIAYAGHTVWLLPEHALWWLEGRVLFIADLHIGKAATFRALGQPVPSGTTFENLRRLSQLISHYQPVQLVFLGDFLHAAQARTASVLSQLGVWRQSHANLNCTLVRGNHDSRAGDPPQELNMLWWMSLTSLAPLQLATTHKRTAPTPCWLATFIRQRNYRVQRVTVCGCRALCLKVAAPSCLHLVNSPGASR